MRGAVTFVRVGQYLSLVSLEPRCPDEEVEGRVRRTPGIPCSVATPLRFSRLQQTARVVRLPRCGDVHRICTKPRAVCGVVADVVALFRFSTYSRMGSVSSHIWGDGDVISSYLIYAICSYAMIWGRL